MSQSVKYLDKSDIKLASLIIFGALGFTLLAVSIFKHVTPNSNVEYNIFKKFIQQCIINVF